MKKKLFTWLAMFCFVVPCVFGLSACKKADPNLTNYKVIVNQQLIAESREIDVTYGDEIEWSAIALYDDNSITAIPATEMQVVDEGEIIGTTPTVGEYELKFKYDEFNEYVVTLTVNPKALAVPTAEVMTYSGEEQTAVFDGFDANTMTMTGDVTATDANTYSVSVALKDKTNYCWTGGSTTDKVVEYTIDKAKIQEPNRVDKTYTYNGTSQTLELFGFDSQTMEVSNNSGINADEYTAYVDIIDEDNYEWKHNSGSRIAIYWTIEKAEGTAPETAPTALSGTYSPSKTLADYDVAEHYAWADETVVPTVAVSEYDVIYNPDPTNYTDFAMTYVLNIAKAQLVIPEVTGAALEYDGTEKTVELAHFDADLMRKSGETSAVEVGEHTMLVIVDNDNYEFDDGSISAELKWNIGKGTPAVTIPYNYSKQYDGQRINLPRYEMPALLKAELEGDADGIVVSYEDANGDAIDFANIVATGEYKIVVETAETTHYKAHSVSQSFKIFYHLTTLYNNESIKVEIKNQIGGSSFYYTGEEIIPVVTITDDRFNLGTPEDPIPYTLVQNEDYVVNGFDNVNYWGNAYIDIEGIGKYSGKIRKKFTIDPQQAIQGVAVNGNPVSNIYEGDSNVATVSNPAGHTITWTFNSIYGTTHSNGYVEIFARDKFYKYLGNPIIVESGVVTAVVPSETTYIEMRFISVNDRKDAKEISFKIILSDEIVNENYFEFNGNVEDVSDWSEYASNTLLIRRNATDMDSTAAQLVTAAFASPSNYSLAEGYVVVEDSFNLSADSKTVSISVKKGEEPAVELVWTVYDARPAFHESYVNFKYVMLDNNDEEGYVTFDTQKTYTIATANENSYMDFSVNSHGNIKKIELYINGEIDESSTVEEERDDGQGINWFRISNFIEAGTYTIRFYYNNASAAYEEYKVVVEEFDDSEAFFTLTYSGKQYILNQSFDGGIFAKMDMMNGEDSQYLYSYVGEIEDGVETITVAIETSLREVYDSNGDLVVDRLAVELEVLSQNGEKYALLNCKDGNMTLPYYIYFKEAPENEFVFNFANYSLNFKSEGVEHNAGNSSNWMFGDFISLEDPADAEVGPMGIKTIVLNAFVEAQDIDFRTDGQLVDETVMMDIESYNPLGMVVYDMVNGNTYSEMVTDLTTVHVEIIEDNGYVFKFYVTSMSMDSPMPSVIYDITVHIF